MKADRRKNFPKSMRTAYRVWGALVSLVLCFSMTACGAGDRQPDYTDELVEEETQINSQPDAPGEDGETQGNDRTDAAREENPDNAAVPGNSGEEQASEENDTSEAPVFDLENGTVMLNSGYEMPILGIGTFRLSGSEAENSVYWALRDGYRLIDTARIYGNEADVGRGIQRAIDEGIVTREEIFVTTKMWTDDFDNGAEAVDASLERLGLDYIDLMILHHSQPRNDVAAYQAMEQAVSEGKLRSIGLSNYYTPEDFDRLVNATSIVPALLQNETHPYCRTAN